MTSTSLKEPTWQLELKEKLALSKVLVTSDPTSPNGGVKTAEFSKVLLSIMVRSTMKKVLISNYFGIIPKRPDLSWVQGKKVQKSLTMSMLITKDVTFSLHLLKSNKSTVTMSISSNAKWSSKVPTAQLLHLLMTTLSHVMLPFSQIYSATLEV